MTKITARPVEDRDFYLLRALYRSVWDDQRDERYDRMRFLDTVDGPPAAAIGLADGMMAGFFMLWPMQLTDGRRVVAGGQAMDVMTDPRFRGQGVFPTLARASCTLAAARGWKLLFGAPNKPIYPTYLKHLGWAAPGEIVTWVRPLALDGITPMGRSAAPLLRVAPGRHASGFQIRHERPDDGALRGLLGKCEARCGVWRVHRSLPWFNFRYQQAGEYDYHWCALWRDGALVGISIWGIIARPRKRLRRANLADYFALDPEGERTVILAAAAAAQAVGAHFMALAMTSAERARRLIRCGFFPTTCSPLIARTLDADSFEANPFLRNTWDLLGADFDFV
jgi:GNAT superfamily N-acetyltransferase